MLYILRYIHSIVDSVILLLSFLDPLSVFLNISTYKMTRFNNFYVMRIIILLGAASHVGASFGPTRQPDHRFSPPPIRRSLSPDSVATVFENSALSPPQMKTGGKLPFSPIVVPGFRSVALRDSQSNLDKKSPLKIAIPEKSRPRRNLSLSPKKSRQASDFVESEVADLSAVPIIEWDSNNHLNPVGLVRLVEAEQDIGNRLNRYIDSTKMRLQGPAIVQSAKKAYINKDFWLENVVPAVLEKFLTALVESPDIVAGQLIERIESLVNHLGLSHLHLAEFKTRLRSIVDEAVRRLRRIDREGVERILSSELIEQTSQLAIFFISGIRCDRINDEDGETYIRLINAHQPLMVIRAEELFVKRIRDLVQDVGVEEFRGSSGEEVAEVGRVVAASYLGFAKEDMINQIFNMLKHSLIDVFVPEIEKSRDLTDFENKARLFLAKSDVTAERIRQGFLVSGASERYIEEKFIELNHNFLPNLYLELK